MIGAVHGRSGERGNIVVLAVFALIPLAGVTGLTIDVTDYFQRRSDVQTTLDAAVLAGARSLQRGLPQSSMESFTEYIYNKNSTNRNWIQNNSWRLDIVERPSGGTYDVTGHITFIYFPSVLSMFGINIIYTDLESHATFGIQQNVEIIFLVDFSEYMWRIPGWSAHSSRTAHYCNRCYWKVDCNLCFARQIDVVMNGLDDAIAALRNVRRTINVSIGLVPIQEGVHLPDQLYFSATGRSYSDYSRLAYHEYDYTNDINGLSWINNDESHYSPRRLNNPPPNNRWNLYTEESLVLPHDNLELKVGGMYTHSSSCMYATDVNIVLATGLFACSPFVVNPGGYCEFGYPMSNTYCTTEHRCVAGRRNDLTNRYPGSLYEDNIPYCGNPVIMPLVDINSSFVDSTIQLWRQSELYGKANGEAGYLWAWNLFSPGWQNELDLHWRNLARIADFTGQNSARKVLVVLLSTETFSGGAPKLEEIASLSGIRGSNASAPNVLERSDIIVEEESPGDTALDRSLDVCNKMKRDGVEIYIVMFDLNTNRNVVDTYTRPCVTGPGYFFSVTDPTSFVQAISNIVNTLDKVRLTD